MTYLGIEYLRNKLKQKSARVEKRYKYYEMKNMTADLNISTPPQLKGWFSSLGWSAKAVDSIADRLLFRDVDNDEFNIQEIFESNNSDILIDSAILSALISSCSFVYIASNEDGSPRLQVIDGANATGVIDPFTNLLTEGYAILSRDPKTGKPMEEAYFTAGRTDIYFEGELVDSFDYPNVPAPLLVPVIYRPDAKRPFGHSRISRSVMDNQDSALRTLKRSEITAEFYSFPQRWASGLATDQEIDKWKASMSAMMTFSKDSDGDSPTIGQFTQQSMQPHIDQLKMFASIVAGETGLTLDDLGFISDNPSSAEAIKSSHENLRLTARKAQKQFGTALLNVGYVAACLRDNFAYNRSEVLKSKINWDPVFEPDASTLSLIGDGIIKINQAMPGYFGEENMRNLTGIKADGHSSPTPFDGDEE